MPAHDIQIKSLLTPEEFLAFKSVCEEFGTSQSARIRFLIKRDIASFVHGSRVEANSKTTMDETVQE